MNRLIPSLFLILLASAYSAPARAVGKLSSPGVTQGELTLEYGATRTFDSDSSRHNGQEHEVEFEYGVTTWWETELALDVEKRPQGSLTAENIAWENSFEFFEKGSYWLDAGIKLTYAHSLQSDEADSLGAKLLLEKNVGRFTHLANLTLKQEIGAHAQGGPNKEIAWSSRWRYSEHFEPGIEIQSDFGKTNENLGFQEQEHFIGPALHGTISGNLKYQAAFLVGATNASADGVARFLLKYEMEP